VNLPAQALDLAVVKTDIEELSPTRVRLTVEVPFDELKPSLDHAYREVGRQVRIPGFRPGHVPRQVLDQRVGRGAVLEHAVNEAMPELYLKAVREAKVPALGQPNVEITRLDDGAEMAFTAEVDVRPSFDIPDFQQVQVVVDDAEVGPDQVEEYLLALRERFGSLRAAGRPAQRGDFVSIDLSTLVDGELVEDAQGAGISYEVGTGTILDGLDDVLVGMSADELATFQTELPGGERAGSLADVTVTVKSVKVKDLPELDDEFAMSASEFNTVGELRSNTRKQMEAVRRVGQVSQARDRALDALLERIDMPLPEAIVEEEIKQRREAMAADLEQARLTLDELAQSRGMKSADLEKEIADGGRASVKARFILDKLAEQEDIKVEQDEIASFITQLAYRQRVAPEHFARELTDSGQLGAVVADLLRSKAADLLAERVKVTDQSGRKVAIGGTAQDGEPAGEAVSDEADEGSAKGGKAKARGRGRRTGKGADQADEPAE
jgi:trigger factor